MAFDAALGDLLTSVNRATSVDEVWASSVAFMSDHGANHVNVTLDADTDEPSLFSTMPSHMIDRFIEELRSDRDPTIAHFRESATPCFAGLEFELHNADLPASRRSMIEDAVGHDMRSALVFPVCDEANRKLHKFGFNTALRGKELMQFHAEYGNSIHLAAVAATERIAMFLNARKKEAVSLTSRERECLLWLARGLRNGRIAERLGVTSVTIEFHMSNACRKLQARTRGQALVRAIQLGVLTP